MSTMERWATRILIALCCGAIVALVALTQVWKGSRSAPLLRYQQFQTQTDLENMPNDIDEYMKLTNCLPQTLVQLRVLSNRYGFRFDKHDVCIDGWGRPYIYTTRGTNFLVESLGRDGVLGGIGLDCDLNTAMAMPPNSRMTFQQFVSERRARGMLLTCLGSGVCAFTICLALTRIRRVNGRTIFILFFEIAATAVGAVIIATILAIFHVPSGH